MNKNTLKNKPKVIHDGNAVRLKIMEFLESRQRIISNVSIEEISQEIGAVKSSVHHHIKMLAREGKITKPAQASRGIEIRATQVRLEAILAYIESDIENGVQINADEWKEDVKKIRKWLTPKGNAKK